MTSLINWLPNLQLGDPSRPWIAAGLLAKSVKFVYWRVTQVCSPASEHVSSLMTLAHPLSSGTNPVGVRRRPLPAVATGPQMHQLLPSASLPRDDSNATSPVATPGQASMHLHFGTCASYTHTSAIGVLSRHSCFFTFSAPVERDTCFMCHLPQPSPAPELVARPRATSPSQKKKKKNRSAISSTCQSRHEVLGEHPTKTMLKE